MVTTFSVLPSPTPILAATDMNQTSLLESEIFFFMMEPFSRFSFYCDSELVIKFEIWALSVSNFVSKFIGCTWNLM